MSLAESALPARAAHRRGGHGLSTIAVTVTALWVFLYVAQHVIDAGYLRSDIAELETGQAWRTGGWLSQLVFAAISVIPDVKLRETALSLLAAACAGLLFAVLYRRLRTTGWVPLGAAAILVALGLHEGVLYSLSAASRGLPLYFATAAIIPALRQLEEVNDVQSYIGIGLLLPLFLLIGPVSTPLVLPFALVAALSNSDGRTDPRAFAAMLLVALIPTVIVALGILGFLTQAGLDVAQALVPYAVVYSQIGWGDVGGSLLSLATFTPVMAVPLLYCLWPDVEGKRHVVSALAVVALPLYYAVARVTLATPMQPIVPPVVLLAGFASWLAVVRLPRTLRAAALIMLALSTVLSWTQLVAWDDPEWRAALFHSVPASLGEFALRGSR